MAKIIKLNNSTKENIINICLDCIVEQRTGMTLNLRDIARRAGCAHTNLYNYFQDLNDMRWQCLLPAYNKLVKHYPEEDIKTTERGLVLFRNYMESYMEAILYQPGLYRFVFLEEFATPMPKEIKIGLEYINQRLKDMVRLGAEEKVSEYYIDRLQDLIFMYFQGEMNHLISNKDIRPQSIEQKKEEIIQNCLLLYDAFKRL
ncbi:TetR/AcrR family transcriptional regulator [Spirochaeta cellobiosiphila]|uniref:TetR/AcrR family transcriptional regulator n=1 Tax=Spirochaeta cellobiosiphila TaxID=504483 RepID=UPI0004112E01|nr:TetR/AcrR family transcriptional regulator [Spirochaeta cellobiosiphila]